MKIPFFVLLLFFVVSDGFSQVDEVDKNKPFFTNVHHNLNNIYVKYYDGTSSTIYLNGNLATIDNSDGTSSTISFARNSSNIVALDGTTSTVLHNGTSSTVINSDETQYIMSHKQNSSSFSTGLGIHTIYHFFGRTKEMLRKDRIDALIHLNWFVQQKQLLIAANKVENK